MDSRERFLALTDEIVAALKGAIEQFNALRQAVIALQAFDDGNADTFIL